MITESNRRTSPLATMLILSAIDVLLCSFTAGVALFLMGDAGSAESLTSSQSSLQNNYLYLKAPMIYHNVAGPNIQFGTIDPDFSVKPHSDVGCTANLNGSIWAIVCPASGGNDWLAEISSTREAEVSMTAIFGNRPLLCKTKVTPGQNLKVFREAPEMRASNIQNDEVSCTQVPEFRR